MAIKPEYEVATVYSTFWGETQVKALEKIIEYLKNMPKIQLAAEDLNIQIVWSARGTRGGKNWRYEASLNTYWTKHFVKEIKLQSKGE